MNLKSALLKPDSHTENTHSSVQKFICGVSLSGSLTATKKSARPHLMPVIIPGSPLRGPV